MASVHLQAAPDLSSPVAAGELVSGKLPNGFSYALLPRMVPGGGLSARLVVRGERGFAHFVEHMDFNGSRHHAAKAVIPFLQGLGLTVGADVNGLSGMTATIYKIDLPDGHSGRVADVLTLFRDFADDIAFDRDEVERQKAVIRSELKARESIRTS